VVANVAVATVVAWGAAGRRGCPQCGHCATLGFTVFPHRGHLITFKDV